MSGVAADDMTAAASKVVCMHERVMAIRRHIAGSFVHAQAGGELGDGLLAILHRKLETAERDLDLALNAYEKKTGA